jgi:hypothetical protein
LLNKDKVTVNEKRNIAYSLYDLEIDSGEVINPIFYSEKEWNTKYKITPFINL